DVHPGNVIVDGPRVGLIDWGSTRIGPPMLDLANLVDSDSDGFAAYKHTWRDLTGVPLDTGQIDVGYRWAALQLPTQYLPWVIQPPPTTEVGAALDHTDQPHPALWPPSV